MRAIITAGVVAIALAGCATRQQSEGTAGGALAGALVGGPVGAAVGAGVGAVVSAPGGVVDEVQGDNRRARRARRR